MPGRPLADAEILRRVDLWRRHDCSANAAARSIGKRHQFIQTAVDMARHRGLLKDVTGKGGKAAAEPLEVVSVEDTSPERIALPKADAAPRGRAIWLLTAAQDETPLHRPFWDNLMAYAAHRGARVMAGGFTYQKGLFEDHAVRTGLFGPEIEAVLQPAVVDLAPGIVWYGKANILPTASDPLSGWETQTRDKWMVAPHAKIALKSVATMPGKRPKQIMTTGVATVENYVQRNAGQKAEFHHTIGATIVEVAEDGAFWCRQISALADGSFQDLDCMVANGRVSTGHRIEAITFGDLHAEVIDRVCARAALGLAPGEDGVMSGAMLDSMKPQAWFIHDSYDFTARSHHTRNDPHERARRIVEGNDDVRQALAGVSAYLAQLRRPFGEIVHVASNHNMHLDNWLKDNRGCADPVNAGYWHALNAAWHEAIAAGASSRWLIHEHALRHLAPDRLDGVRFLSEGESYVVCQGVAPVECGLHSHVGARGARGSLPSLARIVERVNIAHGHGPGIREAAYMAGTLSRRDAAWANKGPGDWQPAHIFTYPNGKRTLITQWDDGRWRLT
jgi:hypothetical protein